jgi:hypothetical protein
VQSLFIHSAEGPLICPTKATAKCVALVRAIVRVKSGEWLRNELAKIGARAASLPFRKVISGKDYIFPLLYMRIRALFQFRGSMEQLKTHLAASCPVRSEWTLTKAVRTL